MDEGNVLGVGGGADDGAGDRYLYEFGQQAGGTIRAGVCDSGGNGSHTFAAQWCTFP